MFKFISDLALNIGETCVDIWDEVKYELCDCDWVFVAMVWVVCGVGIYHVVRSF